MIRSVILLLIACICANVSSEDDCIVGALQILRGKNSNQTVVEQSQYAPTTTVRNDDDLAYFEQLYLNLKQIYDQKLIKLEAENDLLKKLVSTPSQSNVTIHSIQSFCTCHVSETPTNNECSDRQTNIYLEKVQEIHNQLSNITGKIQSIESKNGPSCVRSDAESQEGSQGLFSKSLLLHNQILRRFWQRFERKKISEQAENSLFSERPVNWKKLPGAAVEISAKGRELWVIISSQNIYRWDGSNWELKRGSAVRVGSSPDGWTWVVNRDDKIYRWNVDKNNWDLMPGALVQISAMSKDIALGVNRAQGIYLWSNNAWTQVPGAATWAGIGDGDERWVVNSGQSIFRWNHQTTSWNQMPGVAVNVDVQSPCRVVVTNASNQIFIWKNNNWQIINGAGTRSTINGTHYFTVNSAQHLFIGN